MNDSDKFDVLHTSGRLTILLSSGMGNIEKADIETKRFLMENRLESESFVICLGMREGLTNAIKHGNRFDGSKTVSYSLTRDDSSLTIVIEDQGEGFDWSVIQERMPAVNMDHGRGIAIIQKYFDKYEFNDKGNRLVMIKYLPSRKVAGDVTGQGAASTG